MSEPTAKEIYDGWVKVAENYEPRPLTILERAQFERAALNEKIAENTPFVLGEPIH